MGAGPERQAPSASLEVQAASAGDCCWGSEHGQHESPILVVVDSATGMIFVQEVRLKRAAMEVIEMTICDLEMVGPGARL